MRESGTQHSRPRDAEGARTTILDAAEAIFAEHGFDGARVDAIAAAAGYNKSLLFQYFGDKLQLYGQVLKRADGEANELRARVFAPLLHDPTLASDGRRLRAFFESAFGAIFDHLVSRPHLLRMLQWEMAEGWQTYTRITSTPERDMAQQLEQLFAGAQRAGLLRASFAPAVQLTLALQICQTYLASVPLYQVLTPEPGLTTPAELARARQFVVGLIVGGILVDTPQQDAAEEERS